MRVTIPSARIRKNCKKWYLFRQKQSDFIHYNNFPVHMICKFTKSYFILCSVQKLEYINIMCKDKDKGPLQSNGIQRSRLFHGIQKKKKNIMAFWTVMNRLMQTLWHSCLWLIQFLDRLEKRVFSIVPLDCF